MTESQPDIELAIHPKDGDPTQGDEQAGLEGNALPSSTGTGVSPFFSQVWRLIPFLPDIAGYISNRRDKKKKAKAERIAELKPTVQSRRHKRLISRNSALIFA